MAEWIIDTDPALGHPLSDVDDALAIHLLATSKESVVGLTSCYGNTTGSAAFAVAQHLGHAYGAQVHEGAHRPGHIRTEAVDRLVAHRGAVLALAPLTNLAAALARGAQWERLVVLGGSTRPILNPRPLYTNEFNFALDPGAAAVVLPHVDLLIPMEVCRQVRFHQADLAMLPARLRVACDHWIQLAPLLTFGRGFHPWDVLASMAILEPDLLHTTTARVDLASSKLRAGRIILDRRPARTTVVLGIDTARFRTAWHQRASLDATRQPPYSLA